MDRNERNLLGALGELADRLGPALTPVTLEELLDSITDAAQMLFGAAAVSIALLDEQEGELVFHVASGAGEEEIEGMRMPASKGIAGWVLTSGQTIAIEDLREDERFNKDVAERTGYVPTSILAMPLETERKTLGVISVLDRHTTDGGGDRSKDMELLATFARQASLAIENAGIFSNLGRALFLAMADAVEEKDMAEGLQRVAEDSQGADKEAAELAAAFNELFNAGDEERSLATRVLREVGAYVKQKNARR